MIWGYLLFMAIYFLRHTNGAEVFSRIPRAKGAACAKNSTIHSKYPLLRRSSLFDVR